MANANEFLQAVKIDHSKVDQKLKWVKDWNPADAPFEEKGENVEFFQWVAPGKREFFLVPKELVLETNWIPPNLRMDDTHEYPRPHGAIPDGKKLVWDLAAGSVGKLKLVDVDADLRTDHQKIMDKLEEIKTLIKELL